MTAHQDAYNSGWLNGLRVGYISQCIMTWVVGIFLAAFAGSGGGVVLLTALLAPTLAVIILTVLGALQEVWT